MSPNGQAVVGLGTKDKPFNKLQVALSKITPNKRRIYVCDGTYDEDVVLRTFHAGVSIVGGISCGWQPTPTKARFGKSANPLMVETVAGVVIANVAFEAKDAEPGGSSIAAFVRSADVTFRHVTLSAGKGGKGEDGSLAPFTFPSLQELTGNTGDSGAAAKLVTCPGGGQTSGGEGGFPGVPGASGIPGPSNGGSVSVCSGPGSVSTDGQPGTSPASAAGAHSPGDLPADGWHPGAGADGANGVPGQGGGGGFGSGDGIGGGGGAGGCGGAGGGGGKGGGGSIAVASLFSTVRIEASSLVTSAAGAGGNGAIGQAGQVPGGPGGNGTDATTACNGGKGGNGGNGATGGGGAGGISVGVLYKGQIPTIDATTGGSIVSGPKGKAGAGSGNPGIDGVSSSVLELK